MQAGDCYKGYLKRKKQTYAHQVRKIPCICLLQLPYGILDAAYIYELAREIKCVHKHDKRLEHPVFDQKIKLQM